MHETMASPYDWKPAGGPLRSFTFEFGANDLQHQQTQSSKSILIQLVFFVCGVFIRKRVYMTKID